MDNIKTDFNNALKEVKGLVSDFKANEQYYLSSKYSEAEEGKISQN
jgi:hypothetical protein